MKYDAHGISAGRVPGPSPPSSCRDELLRRLATLVGAQRPTVFFLEAGHYDPRFGVTPFARRSLAEALDVTASLIKRFKRSARVVLGVLVDDLGLSCGASDVCQVLPVGKSAGVEDGELPLDLEEILESSRFVKRNRVVVSSERNAKNRSLSRLRRLLSTQGATASNGGTGELALRSEGLQREPQNGCERISLSMPRPIRLADVCDGTWTAKCPLIMAQHYLDVARLLSQRFPEQPRIVLVDYSEMLDSAKVTAGAEVAAWMARTGQFSIDIINIFCGDDDLSIYQIHHVSSLR